MASTIRPPEDGDTETRRRIGERTWTLATWARAGWDGSGRATVIRGRNAGNLREGRRRFREISTEEGRDRACKPRVYRPRPNNDRSLRSACLSRDPLRCTSRMVVRFIASEWSCLDRGSSDQRINGSRGSACGRTSTSGRLENSAYVFATEQASGSTVNVRNASGAHQKRT